MKYIMEYVLSIAGIVILNVITESVMPSNSFKKYIKSVLGLVIIIVLAKPLLNFTDFEIKLESFVLSTESYYDDEQDIQQVFDENIEIQFEKSLSESIKKDIEENFNVPCNVYAKCDITDIKSVQIECKENFESIKSYIDKKYDVNCTKK